MNPELASKRWADFPFPVFAAVHQFLDSASTHFPDSINLLFRGYQILKNFRILIFGHLPVITC